MNIVSTGSKMRRCISVKSSVCACVYCAYDVVQEHAEKVVLSLDFRMKKSFACSCVGDRVSFGGVYEVVKDVAERFECCVLGYFRRVVRRKWDELIVSRRRFAEGWKKRSPLSLSCAGGLRL